MVAKSSLAMASLLSIWWLLMDGSSYTGMTIPCWSLLDGYLNTCPVLRNWDQAEDIRGWWRHRGLENIRRKWLRRRIMTSRTLQDVSMTIQWRDDVQWLRGQWGWIWNILRSSRRIHGVWMTALMLCVFIGRRVIIYPGMKTLCKYMHFSKDPIHDMPW